MNRHMPYFKASTINDSSCHQCVREATSGLFIQKQIPFAKKICSFQYSSSVRNFRSFWRSFIRSCLSRTHCRLDITQKTQMFKFKGWLEGSTNSLLYTPRCQTHIQLSRSTRITIIHKCIYLCLYLSKTIITARVEEKLLCAISLRHNKASQQRRRFTK